MGGKRDMFLIKKILKDFDVIYFKYDSTLMQSIENLAKKLKNFVDGLKLKKNEKVGIIGVSAGGVVADYYLKFFGGWKKTSKFVSICSPLHGTYLSLFEFLFFGKRIGLKQIGRKSDLIKKLESVKLKKVKQLNFWSYLDPLVPGKSGKGENSKHTWFFIHLIVHFWPPLVYKIKKFMENG